LDVFNCVDIQQETLDALRDRDVSVTSCEISVVDDVITHHTERWWRWGLTAALT